MRGSIQAVCDLLADGGGDRGAVVIDVDDVRAPFPPVLATADVDRRRAEERTLANERARVPCQTCGTAHQPQKGFDREILVEPDVLRFSTLSDLPHYARDVLGSSVESLPQLD